MTELIKLRTLKSVKPRSYTFTTAESSSDSSDDESSSNDESPVVLKLQSKSLKKSKRNNKIQTLPVIINTQPIKQKKKHHRQHVQQFLINTQPPSPTKKEVVIKQMIEPTLSPEIQYLPVAPSITSLSTIVQRKPLVYQRLYTPSLIDDYPFPMYRSCESPVRRVVRVQPSNTRSVHLPKHAKKLVNRFLNGMEHAHGCRHMDENDSDCSIDDCKVCRRLRSVMDDRRRRSNSELDLYRSNRVLFETQEPHRHKYGHSKDCRVCNLLEKSDFVISTTKDHSTTSRKKRGKHVHVVESFPSNVKPAVETTTTTTTTTQPKVVVNTVPATAPPLPIQPSYYPMPYTNYVDPNTGLTYAYDPNWQYDPSGAAVTYDYSSYYTNPTYTQSNPQYEVQNTIVPTVTNSISSPTEQQQQIRTTTIVSPNPLMDKGTYTRMRDDRKKHKPTNKTVVIHTSRNPTPPPPKIIIEQPRPTRLPRKLQSKTVLKERTTQTPHTTTTTYIQT